MAAAPPHATPESDGGQQREHERARALSATSSMRGEARRRCAQQQRQAGPGEHDGQHATEESRHERLRHLQPQQLRARGADRAPHGEVALAALGAHHEEVRHVHAGDQQHDGGGGEQDPQRARGRAEHLVEQRPHDGAMALDEPRVAGRAAEALGQPARKRRQLRFRSRELGARSQTPHHGVAEAAGRQPLGANLAHDPEERPAVREAELRRQHADDGPALARHVVGAPDDARIGAEPRAPERVADQGHAILVGRHGQAAERRLAPSVENSDRVPKAIWIRSTRSPTRRLLVKLP